MLAEGEKKDRLKSKFNLDSTCNKREREVEGFGRRVFAYVLSVSNCCHSLYLVDLYSSSHPCIHLPKRAMFTSELQREVVPQSGVEKRAIWW